jgi:hypothetical protein
MTREKQHRMNKILAFVDLFHKFQRASSNSLFAGSPRWGVARYSIPEFDLILDRSFTPGWTDGGNSTPATYQLEISSQEVMVSVTITVPYDPWPQWDHITYNTRAKWSVEWTGDLEVLDGVEVWMKFNWPIDSN